VFELSSVRRWAVAALLGAVAPAAWGYVNPNFTPIHLTEQSGQILRVKVAGKVVGDAVELPVVAALKGAKPAKITVDLTKAPKAHADAARKTLSAAVGREALLFSGKYEAETIGYLHVAGTWMRLSGSGAAWTLDAIDQNMPGTWAGATDMLARCVRYIIAAKGEADVPVDGGTAWRTVAKVAAYKAKPKPRAVRAVDLAGDGKVCLYVGSPAGDRLFRAAKGCEKFEDVTRKVKLAARSAASAWGDFNADGRVDLASFDGKALTIWRQGADGTFSPVKAGGTFALPAKTASLAVVGIGAKAPPALVASAAVPVVLVADAQGGFKALPMPKAPAAAAKYGKAQAALVGDFNSDRIPDILVPFETGGLLYAGTQAGRFAAGKPCGVDCTKGGGTAAVGDFDDDGWLDVLAAGAGGVKVFHNLRNGTFAETLGGSGEVAYKAQPFAAGCGVCDFNNDARQDVFFMYSGQAPLLYFNRGFRSFGEAPKLEMALVDITGLDEGQEMGVFADFDHDGAEDFVVLMPDGSIWCAANELGDEDALCIRARLSASSKVAGPVSVTAWRGRRRLGTWPVAAGAKPAFIGIAEAGAYVLKWRLPGRPERTHKVTVEDAPVDVVLDKVAPPKTKPAK